MLPSSERLIGCFYCDHPRATEKVRLTELACWRVMSLLGQRARPAASNATTPGAVFESTCRDVLSWPRWKVMLLPNSGLGPGCAERDHPEPSLRVPRRDVPS
jgi:hypothetical protein